MAFFTSDKDFLAIGELDRVPEQRHASNTLSKYIMAPEILCPKDSQGYKRVGNISLCIAY